MSGIDVGSVGYMFRCDLPPEQIAVAARRAETLGFDAFWVVEDCFRAGGIAAATIALAATERIHVGLGIMPAPVRNAAFVAMEIATLARAFPGRFLPGFGHGVPDWMRQVGDHPGSVLGALSAVLTTTRGLLAGETVTHDDPWVHLDGIRLDHRPDAVPPVFGGVQGPKSLQVVGRDADGAILAEPLSTGYVAAARGHLAAGRGGSLDGFPVVGYAWFAVDEDADRGRDIVRPTLASTYDAMSLVPDRWPDEVLAETRPLREAHGDDDAAFAAAIPDAAVDRMTVSGTPEMCVASIRALFAAGVTQVVLAPPTESALDQLERAGTMVLPLLRGA